MQSTDDRLTTSHNASAELDGLTIGIAGLGNLGSSIAGALISRGWPLERLLVSSRGSVASRERAMRLGLLGHVVTTKELMARADIVLVTVRPQDASSFVGAPSKPGSLVISLMAGLTLSLLRKIFTCEVCRAMSSGPATIDSGTALGVVFEGGERSMAVMRAAGYEAIRVDAEDDLIAFTVGICVPPVAAWLQASDEDRRGAFDVMARRHPIFSDIERWIHRTRSTEDLDVMATSGGVTEAMLNAADGGATLLEAIEAGMVRNEMLGEDAERAASLVLDGAREG